MSERKILLLGTGGTIAGKAQDAAQAVGYRAAEIGVAELIGGLLGIKALEGVMVEAVQLAQVDSKDMNWSIWRSLLAQCLSAMDDPQVHAIVITHGTDTLEETGWFLAALLEARKPVVLTCAMRPATALLSDGPQNLLDSLCVAASGGRPGVWFVAAGKVFAAESVQKVHPYRLDAFSSYELGVCGFVEEQTVRWCSAGMPPRMPVPLHDASSGRAVQVPVASASSLFDLEALPWVEVVFSAALADGRQVEALVAAGVRGIVVAGSGNASVHEQLAAALSEARKRGVWVWHASRCLEGVPVAGRCLGPAISESDHQALAIGLVPSKARIAMMLGLVAREAG